MSSPHPAVAGLRHVPPLSPFFRRLLSFVAIEEVDDEGARRIGERIPALPIPGVPPSHRPGATPSPPPPKPAAFAVSRRAIVQPSSSSSSIYGGGGARRRGGGLSKEEAGRSNANDWI